jgi:hypothetical protein
MNLKKQLIVGSILMVAPICMLIQWISNVVEHQWSIPPGFSGNLAITIGIVASIYAVGSIVFGVLMVVTRSDKFDQWNKRFTLTAKIPAIFGLAFIPVFAGLVLIVLTRQVSWGFWLSCLSFPAVLIFLLLEIREIRN